MKNKILKIGFEERDNNCYCIRGDIGDLDFQYSENEDNIGIIMMGAMTENVKDLKHLDDIKKSWDNLWMTICYTE